ncbi:MAG TPA: acyl-CoA dehydrogenase family protein [Povalibacter sp.]|uniref:acyl-CoA dehydrogenase family protein n=1 Tax=Povalibacter sp. TaxID=1962978 RepID=UPI002C9A8252|nr:acyl-CoA dehydrogenase family protein [Povalibacter sp.]HMN43387.1 acyl-CoA dehydrogenase family protein [Povalibacter sp.]
MSLVLNEDQLMFRDAAKRFAAERAPIAELRRLRDSNDATGFDRAVWKEMAEMGWAGVLVPEEHGGVGFGHVGAGLIAQEIGRNLSATPFVSTAVLGVTALLKGGSDAQKQALLPKMAAGEVVLALASDERSRHSPYNVATRAVGSAGKYKLSGAKVHVLDGHVADRLIVSARTSGDVDGRDGMTLFLVDPKAAGVSIRRVSIVDSRNAATVELRDVAVTSDDVIGAVDKGAAILDAVLDAGRAVLAAELLGLSEEAFERTLGYLRERDQFGVKIGTFQGLQHRAAHLFCEIELVRSTVLRALQSLDAQEKHASSLICLAKGKASDVARLATNEAVQMHGGIGMTDEFDIGFFMKRACAAGETFGDAYFHTDRFAQLSGY